MQCILSNQFLNVIHEKSEIMGQLMMDAKVWTHKAWDECNHLLYKVEDNRITSTSLLSL